MGPLRAKLGTLAAEAVVGFDFENVPGALFSPKQGDRGAPDEKIRR